MPIPKDPAFGELSSPRGEGETLLEAGTPPKSSKIKSFSFFPTQIFSLDALQLLRIIVKAKAT